MKTDREKLKDAMKELRKRGYIATMSGPCCQSCSWAKLETRFKNKQRKTGIVDDDMLEALWESQAIVFSHAQGMAVFKNGNNIGTGRSICLYHHGTPKEIHGAVQVLQSHGLNAVWSGDGAQAIQIFKSVDLMNEVESLRKQLAELAQFVDEELEPQLMVLRHNSLERATNADQQERFTKAAEELSHKSYRSEMFTRLSRMAIRDAEASIEVINTMKEYDSAETSDPDQTGS